MSNRAKITHNKETIIIKLTKNELSLINYIIYFQYKSFKLSTGLDIINRNRRSQYFNLKFY